MEDTQPTQLPERVSLPTATVNEILSVFSQMPYNQVAQLIVKIQSEVQPIMEDVVDKGASRTIKMPAPKK